MHSRRHTLVTAMEARLLILVLVSAAAAVAPLASAGAPPANPALSREFYQKTCPDAEKIVFGVVEKRFKQDSATSALLLRLIFHDCFANGCDASILIDPLSNQSAEKEAGPNVSVGGYDVIEEAKAEIEKKCPGVVSCADILALSARDGVRLSGGPAYEVPLGRLDSLVSNRDDADNLPGPDIAVPKLMEMFADKGFSTEEMVMLLAGGHSIGTVKCFFIEADAAPIDDAYRANISKTCDGKDREAATVSMDMVTPDVFDANYFADVLAKRMPLTIDRLLGLDSRTEPIIKSMAAKTSDFVPMFAKAMEKLSVLKVLTGKDGEVRKVCSEFSKPTKTDDAPSVIRISSASDGETEGLTGPAAKIGLEGRKVAGGAVVGAKEATEEARVSNGEPNSKEASGGVPILP